MMILGKKMSSKTILTLLCAFVGNFISAQELKWYNPENAGCPVVQGQAFSGEARECIYNRLPDRVVGTLPKGVARLSRQTAGESVCFTTDSKNITVRYRVKRRLQMHHMPATGVSGVDLYTSDKDGKELWLAARYSFKDTVKFVYSDIAPLNMSCENHRYTLFLPLYNEVEWMEIGVDKDAEFAFEKVSSLKPIVAYGTSICQGACASRPAMAWTNILQRRLDYPIVNLGFSGSAKFENSVIEALTEIDAAVYVIDGMPNAYAIPSPALQDTLSKAIRQIRAIRPDTPIVLVDHCGYPHGAVYKKYRDAQEHALSALEEVYQQLRKEGVKGLCRLRHQDIGLLGEMTVEAIHMSDYGMTNYADAYEPLLKKILKKVSAKKGTVLK